MGYAPIVAERLNDIVTIISPPKLQGGDSANLQKVLDQWLKDKPDLVVFNCGLHDIKLKDGKHQVSPVEYEKNLKTIIARLRATGAKVVFATTTPINDERHRARKAGFERTEAAVTKYNEIAIKIMKAEKVDIIDLHAAVVAGGTDKLLGKDGTHYTPEGYTMLAAAVAKAVRSHIAK